MQEVNVEMSDEGEVAAQTRRDDIEALPTFGDVTGTALTAPVWAAFIPIFILSQHQSPERERERKQLA